jgi:hypothetical protein
MEVRSGWNSEFARKKYDVTLDEADLARLLLGAGIPLEAQPLLPAGDVHTILYCTAEILARTTLAAYAKAEPGGFPPDFRQRLADEARVLRDQRTAALTKVKSAWEAQEELRGERSG